MLIARFVIASAVVWCAAASVAVGQSARADGARLDAEETRLAEGSRASIIAAGVTPKFFDRHFRLEQVSNLPSDRRVVWRIKVGEHEALVSDPVGSYTDERGRRHDAHSVAALVTPARDIGRTITRRRAERLMRACIGEYRNGATVYQLFGSPPRASLVFTAVSAPEPQQPAATTNATGATNPTSAVTRAPSQSDPIRQGGRKRPPPRVGMLNLETGRCIVGVGQSGSPHPDAEKIIRPRR